MFTNLNMFLFKLLDSKNDKLESMLLKNYGRKVRVFVAGRPFQPSLISVSKAGAYPSLPATFKVEESASLPLFQNAFCLNYLVVKTTSWSLCH